LPLAAPSDTALRPHLPRLRKRRSRWGLRSGGGRAAEAPFLRPVPLLFPARHLFSPRFLATKNPPGPALGGWERSVAAVSLTQVGPPETGALVPPTLDPPFGAMGTSRLTGATNVFINW